MQPCTLLLGGDVMTGRGIDQALEHPGDPTLFEPAVGDARRYVALAEMAHGPFARPLAPADVWGDALAEMDRVRPDARIVNLETAVTTSADRCRRKEVLSRMHPANVACLAAARIDVVADFSAATADDVLARIAAVKRPGDVAVASIHQGGNWGHEVCDEFAAFAQRLVAGGVDVVHGHSSHHVGPIGMHGGKLILYGCGDLVDDYEGIRGYEAFRPDLGLLYVVTVDPRDGRLLGLTMVPLRMERFRLRRAGADDSAWLAGTLSSTSGRFGCRVITTDDGGLALRW